MKFVWWLTVWLFGMACSAALDGDLPGTLEEARRLGQAQEHGEKTRDYHTKVLMPYFGKKYANVFKDCFARVSSPDARPYAFVAAIGANGEVLRVYHDVDTNIFQCMNAVPVHETFPSPPVAPYFLHIDMKFKD